MTYGTDTLMTSDGSSGRRIRPLLRPRTVLAVWAAATLSMVAYAAASPLVERFVEATIVASAARRGWDLSAQKVTVGTDLSVVLTGVKAAGPGASRATIEQLRAEWEPLALLGGQRSPSAIHVEGLDAVVHAGRLRHGLGSADALSSEALTRTSDTTVDVHRATATVDGLPGLGTIVITDLEVTAESRPAARRATFSGRCTTGCAAPHRFSGTASSHGDQIHVSVEVNEPVTVDLDWPGAPTSVSARRLTATLTRATGDLRIGAEGLEIPVSRGGLNGLLKVEAAEVRVDPSRPFSLGGHLTLRRPHLTLTRSATSPADKPIARNAKLAALEGLLSRALPLLRRVDVEDGSLTVSPWNVHVEHIEMNTEEHRTTMGGDLGGGRLTLALRDESPNLEVHLHEVEVRSLAAELVPSLRIAGRVDGRVALSIQPDDRSATVEADLHVLDGTLQQPAIAPAPLRVREARLQLRGHAVEASEDTAETLEISRGRLTLGADDAPVSVNLRGTVVGLHGRDAPKMNLSVWLDETPCAAAIDALPTAMVPHLRGEIELEGHFAPRVDFSVDMRDTATTKLAVTGLPGSCVVSGLGAYAPDFLNDDFALDVREGVSEPGLVTVGPSSGSYTPLSQIPEYVAAAMYLTEEASFYRNHGFGLGLIRRALKINLDKGKYVYGGSSVSQQLVKNLFLSRDKTLARKLEEALIVWRLEAVVSKDRILELYMNCIEFGPDLYGITAASRTYFDKRPADLTPMEGAFLAGLKPAPWNGPGFKRAGHTPAHGWWHKRLRIITERLHEYGHIDAEVVERARPYVLFFPGHSWDDYPDLAYLRPAAGATRDGSLDTESTPESPVPATMRLEDLPAGRAN